MMMMSIDIRRKFYKERPRGTPTSRMGEQNAIGVAKYNDFRNFDLSQAISETV